MLTDSQRNRLNKNLDQWLDKWILGVRKRMICFVSAFEILLFYYNASEDKYLLFSLVFSNICCLSVTKSSRFAPILSINFKMTMRPDIIHYFQLDKHQ